METGDAIVSLSSENGSLSVRFGDLFRRLSVLSSSSRRLDSRGMGSLSVLFGDRFRRLVAPSSSFRRLVVLSSSRRRPVLLSPLVGGGELLVESLLGERVLLGRLLDAEVPALIPLAELEFPIELADPCSFSEVVEEVVRRTLRFTLRDRVRLDAGLERSVLSELFVRLTPRLGSRGGLLLLDASERSEVKRPDRGFNPLLSSAELFLSIGRLRAGFSSKLSESMLFVRPGGLLRPERADDSSSSREFWRLGRLLSNGWEPCRFDCSFASDPSLCDFR